MNLRDDARESVLSQYLQRFAKVQVVVKGSESCFSLLDKTTCFRTGVHVLCLRLHAARCSLFFFKQVQLAAQCGPGAVCQM